MLRLFNAPVQPARKHLLGKIISRHFSLPPRRARREKTLTSCLETLLLALACTSGAAVRLCPCLCSSSLVRSAGRFHVFGESDRLHFRSRSPEAPALASNSSRRNFVGSGTPRNIPSPKTRLPGIRERSRRGPVQTPRIVLALSPTKRSP